MSRNSAIRRGLAAAAAYFAAVFAAGFALGTLRTLLIAPRIGDLAATLVELPVILIIAWVACGWVLRRFPQVRTAPLALLMGAVALILLLLAEALLSVGLSGLTLSQHLALYHRLPVQLGLLAQIGFAAFPLMRFKTTSD